MKTYEERFRKENEFKEELDFHISNISHKLKHAAFDISSIIVGAFDFSSVHCGGV
jgi:hypothetical protein